jgi:membrane-bound metal-dependent hydrolase YbcI (DUF457 family)
LWATLLLAALFAGSGAMAVLIGPVAALAGLQAARSWRHSPKPRPIEAVAAVDAGAIVGGAVFGIVGVATAAAAATAFTLGFAQVVEARRRAGRVRVPRSALRTLVVAAVPAVAGASPVLLRSMGHRGATPTLALCSFALVYDASAFLIGAEAKHRWIGPAAGIVSIAVVTVAVAAILVPPFRGTTPWVVGLLAVLSAPLGPMVATASLGDRRASAPALRRLDSLLVLGPLCAGVMLAWLG